MAQRTTLTLEADVAARLRERARQTGKPLKTVVDEALRNGLDRLQAAPAPFRVAARDLGVRPGIDLDDVAGLIERLEGPLHR